jgi:hypothetical protein
MSVPTSESSESWTEADLELQRSESLRQRIRAAIQSGKLPQAQGYRLFGGKGDGSLCVCCDRFITGAEIQFDLECPTASHSWVSLAMHLLCFELWRSEGRLQARAAALVSAAASHVNHAA